MNKAYLFKISNLNFILNVQESSIGFVYPRLFIEFPDNSHLNLDLSIGSMFAMSQHDWDSWFDDEMIKLDSIVEVEEIASSVGINWKALEDLIFEWLKNAEED